VSTRPPLPPVTRSPSPPSPSPEAHPARLGRRPHLPRLPSSSATPSAPGCSEGLSQLPSAGHYRPPHGSGTRETRPHPPAPPTGAPAPGGRPCPSSPPSASTPRPWRTASTAPSAWRWRASAPPAPAPRSGGPRSWTASWTWTAACGSPSARPATDMAMARALVQFLGANLRDDDGASMDYVTPAHLPEREDPDDDESDWLYDEPRDGEDEGQPLYLGWDGELYRARRAAQAGRAPRRLLPPPLRLRVRLHADPLPLRGPPGDRRVADGAPDGTPYAAARAIWSWAAANWFVGPRQGDAGGRPGAAGAARRHHARHHLLADGWRRPRRASRPAGGSTRSCPRSPSGPSPASPTGPPGGGYRTSRQP
jgi:hypothetical protein